MENKNKGNEKKKKNLIALWIKWTGTVKTKHTDFVGADPINLCQNSPIIGLRMYGEGRTKIPPSSLATIYPLARVKDTDINIASNTKINHMMVSLLISTMLFLLTYSPEKLKLEKIHCTLIILFYVKPSHPRLQSLFLLETHTKNYLFIKCFVGKHQMQF